MLTDAEWITPSPIALIQTQPSSTPFANPRATARTFLGLSIKRGISPRVRVGDNTHPRMVTRLDEAVCDPLPGSQDASRGDDMRQHASVR
jgi:hypothetical protein